MSQLKPKILKSFGYLVKQRRLFLGISQEELGLRANLDRTYISGIERGIRNPSLTALVDLAQGLGISVSEMLDQLENVAEIQL
jgi:transcriptional regulator with XRE-family HTH domain